MEESNKNIIISADDFGISQLANENILKLVRGNKLDRVEIMMSNNLKPEHISALLASGVKLDIHLHLAKDKLDYWQNNKRVIEKGALKRIFLFLWNFFFGKNRPKRVTEEWEKQIKMFKNTFGKNPDGFSSHEHIHFFPPYFKIITELSEKYNAGYIRLGKEPLLENNKVCAILNWLRKANRGIFKKYRLNSSDLMASFDWTNDWDLLLKNLPDHKTTEIIFHPELEKEFKVLEKL
jgi:predicted glycoside hydrolase/deacetylase ChbG (UPF0249 family)